MLLMRIVKVVSWHLLKWLLNVLVLELTAFELNSFVQFLKIVHFVRYHLICNGLVPISSVLLDVIEHFRELLLDIRYHKFL